MADMLGAILLARAEETPDDPNLWLAAARTLALEGRGAEADAAFERYFALLPARKLVAEGAERQRAGDLGGAVSLYRRALALDPNDVDGLRFLGLALASLGRSEEALRSARRATEIKPDHVPAWSDLGAVLSELDRAEEAVEAYAMAARLRPSHPAALAHLGNALLAAGDAMRAEKAYRAALAQDPAEPASLLGLGHALKTIGRQDEAVAAYRACLAARPIAGEAWWSLANLKTVRFGDNDEAQMRQMLAAPDLPDSTRINLAFALGKAREDAADYDAAFAHYTEGARPQRARVRYDPVQTETINARIRAVFTRDLFERFVEAGEPDPSPIFIVGLPRSGSTLIEQILASHSQVEGTSELPALGKVTMEIGRFRSDGVVYPEAVRDLERRDLAALGRAYLARTARHRTGAPHFTDKMPNKFPGVGLISLILPNARIIDARRHPMDSCFGAFKQLFARGQTFSYDLFDLGHFYLEYDAMMRWWDEVLPGKVLRVNYEELVLDQEAQTRRLLAHCGLGFEERCLSFHETQRAVNTASSEQVRKPLYRSGMGAWRKFERHLAPLAAQLAPVIARLPEPVREAAG